MIGSATVILFSAIAATMLDIEQLIAIEAVLAVVMLYGVVMHLINNKKNN